MAASKSSGPRAPSESLLVFDRCANSMSELVLSSTNRRAWSVRRTRFRRQFSNSARGRVRWRYRNSFRSSRVRRTCTFTTWALSSHSRSWHASRALGVSSDHATMRAVRASPSTSIADSIVECNPSAPDCSPPNLDSALLRRAFQPASARNRPPK